MIQASGSLELIIARTAQSEYLIFRFAFVSLDFVCVSAFTFLEKEGTYVARAHMVVDGLMCRAHSVQDQHSNLSAF